MAATKVSAAKTAAQKPAAPPQESPATTAHESVRKTATARKSPTQKKETKPAFKLRTEIDPKAVITVKNGYPGQLVYVSHKTGERFIWSGFGDEQEMEFAELKNAKNSSKAFFINNWFLIDDPSVLEALGVEKYYENALSATEFLALFEQSPEEIKTVISQMSSGQRDALKYRARYLMVDGDLDSIGTIKALEESLGILLLDR